MKVDTSSTQTRLIIAASIAWGIAAALIADSANRYSDFEFREWLPPFLALSFPVWGFWGCGWIFGWALPFRGRPNRRWVSVSPEEAARHPLYGIGGWTAFQAAGLWLGAGILIVSAGATSLALNDLPSSDLRTYGILSAALSIWNVFVLLGVLILLHKKHRSFQVAAVLVYVYFLAFPILSGVSAILIIEPDYIIRGGIMDDAFKNTAKQMIPSLLWIAYVIRSRRVNVTFSHRIRQRDLLLIRPVAQAPVPSDGAVSLSYEQTVLRMMEEQR